MSLDVRPILSKLAEEESVVWNTISETILEFSSVKCITHTPDCTQDGKLRTLTILSRKVIKMSLAVNVKTFRITLTFIVLCHVGIYEKKFTFKSKRTLSRSLK